MALGCHCGYGESSGGDGKRQPLDSLGRTDEKAAATPQTRRTTGDWLAVLCCSSAGIPPFARNDWSNDRQRLGRVPGGWRYHFQRGSLWVPPDFFRRRFLLLYEYMQMNPSSTS